MGYGVWAYKNYADNLIYNPQFALGEDGWIFEGGVEAVEYSGSMQAKLPVGGRLSNAISRRSLTYVSFTVDGDQPVTLQVSLGGNAGIVPYNINSTQKMMENRRNHSCCTPHAAPL